MASDSLSKLALELATGANHAYLTTLMPDGSPQSSPVWVDSDGTHLLVNTNVQTQKARNVRRDARVAITIPDQKNPLTKVDVRGRVTRFVEGPEALEHMDRLAQRYLGLPQNPWRVPDERRVLLYITPLRLTEARAEFDLSS